MNVPQNKSAKRSNRKPPKVRVGTPNRVELSPKYLTCDRAIAFWTSLCVPGVACEDKYFFTAGRWGTSPVRVPRFHVNRPLVFRFLTVPIVRPMSHYPGCCFLLIKLTSLRGWTGDAKRLALTQVINTGYVLWRRRGEDVERDSCMESISHSTPLSIFFPPSFALMD